MPQSKAKQRACPKGTRSYVRFQVQQSPSVQNVGWRGLLGLFAALAPEQSKAAREREIDTDICCPQPLKPQASKQDTEIEKQREREREKKTQSEDFDFSDGEFKQSPRWGGNHKGSKGQGQDTWASPLNHRLRQRLPRDACAPDAGGENVGMVRQCEPSSRSSSVSK